MCRIISLEMTIIAGLSMVQAGFLGSPLSYGAKFQSPLSYAAPDYFGSTYSAAFSQSPNPYGVIYATPPVPRYHRSGFNHFTAFGSTPDFAKIAHPAAVPSFYNSPLSYGHSGLAFNGYASPNSFVKYGHPITTTTTTYSTAAVAGLSFPNPLNSMSGW